MVPEGGLEDEEVRVVWYLVGWRAVRAGVSSPPLLSPHTAARVRGLTLTRLATKHSTLSDTASHLSSHLDKHELGAASQPRTLVGRQVDQDVVVDSERIVSSEYGPVVFPVREDEDRQSCPATLTEISRSKLRTSNNFSNQT